MFTVVVCIFLTFDVLLIAWAETTKEFVAKLGLKPGQKVLDVGCGVGGGDFYMAENFDVEVIGIDLSINMISLAIERAIGLNYAVELNLIVRIAIKKHILRIHLM